MPPKLRLRMLLDTFHFHFSLLDFFTLPPQRVSVACASLSRPQSTQVSSQPNVPQTRYCYTPYSGKYRSRSKPLETILLATDHPTAARCSPETAPGTKTDTPASRSAEQKEKIAENKSPS